MIKYQTLKPTDRSCSLSRILILNSINQVSIEEWERNYMTIFFRVISVSIKTLGIIGVLINCNE